MRALLLKLAAMWIIVGFYVGCSPVKFSLDDSKCKNDGCLLIDGKYSFKYSATAGFGKVDILIVNDNSASMSFEQARLAPRFNDFINDLDSRKIDYRIGVTTTDVSGSSAGKLLSIDGNGSFLTSDNSSTQSFFEQIIQRGETLSCESFIADWIRNHGGTSGAVNASGYSLEYATNCPSGDERGIYAANLVIKNNPDNFIRSDAHLAIIFLSDEDERSALYGNSAFSLDEMDQPSYLVSNVKSKLGDDKFNSLSVHAIVVKDQVCLNQQNSQTLDSYAPTTGLVKGSIGSVYLSFVDKGWGNSADICSNDYTSQLGQIRSKITDRIKDIMLHCSNPTNMVVTLSGNPVAHSIIGKILKFDQFLDPGTNVNLSYQCDQLN